MKTTKKQHQQRMEELRAVARAHVTLGCCPDCGSPLERNSGMAGWWQCAAYPALSHRSPQFATLPKCHFQCFTE